MVVKHLNGSGKHVGSSCLEILRSCLGIALNKLLKLGLIYFVKKHTLMPSETSLPVMTYYLITASFSCKYLRQDVIKSIFLNSSFAWIALSTCCRHIPQQQEEQTEFTSSDSSAAL